MSATEQVSQVGNGQHQHAQHAVGAVDQRQALLLPQRDRRDPGCRQRLGGWPLAAAGICDNALAHDRQRAVRERGEVAGAAEAAVLVHDWREAGVQQRRIGLNGPLARPGQPGRQRSQPEQHQRPDYLGPRPAARSRPRGCGPGLPAAAPAARPGYGGWPARRTRWRRRNAARVLRQRVDDLAAAPDCREGFGRQRDLGSAPGDGDHVGGGRAARPHRDDRRSDEPVCRADRPLAARNVVMAISLRWARYPGVGPPGRPVARHAWAQRLCVYLYLQAMCI